MILVKHFKIFESSLNLLKFFTEDCLLDITFWIYKLQKEGNVENRKCENVSYSVETLIRNFHSVTKLSVTLNISSLFSFVVRRTVTDHSLSECSFVCHLTLSQNSVLHH